MQSGDRLLGKMILHFVLIISMYLLYVSGSRLHQSLVNRQLEFAYRSTEEGSTFIVATSRSGTVIASHQKGDASIEMPHDHFAVVSPSLIVGTAGLASDSAHLIERLYSSHEFFSYAFGCEPTIRRLASNLAEYMHEKTLSAHARPFAASVVLIDCTEEHKEIFTVDSSGAVIRSNFAAIGWRTII